MKTIILVIFILLFNACGTKVPFTEDKASDKTALLYIYVPNETHLTSDVDRDSSYKIKINEDSLENYLSSGEYTKLFLKPTKVDIEVIKNAILSEKISLNLKAAHTYFVKIEEKNSEEFSLLVVSKDLAINEIQKTYLSGAFEDDQKSKSVIIKPNAQENSSQSKIEAIKKAYQLKEEGIITAEEFQKLKEDILSK